MLTRREFIAGCAAIVAVPVLLRVPEAVADQTVYLANASNEIWHGGVDLGLFKTHPLFANGELGTWRNIVLLQYQTSETIADALPKSRHYNPSQRRRFPIAL